MVTIVFRNKSKLVFGANTIRPRLLVSCIALLILISAGTAGVMRATNVVATTSTLAVSGNHLVDNGQTVVLRGVNRDGSEYACYQGWGIFDGPSDDASVAAIAAWGANAVRVPLNEDCWLGINGINPANSGANYQAAITGFVTRLRAHGLYVILSSQVAGPGATVSTTILPMPDADHAPSFWSSVASTFASDKGVIFDLYNEPHDVSWSCWANGCLVTGGVNWVANYQAAGMNSLTAAIRNAGATNVIMIGGLGWSIDTSGWLANQPADSQLMVSVHNYDYTGWNTPTVWNSVYAPIALQVPITIGETGFDGYVEQIMPWADAHGIGYLAWTWDTWGNNEALISNYNGTPTTPYGLGFKNFLAGVPTPSPTPTPTPTVPTVSSVSPNTGPTSGGTSVTITGTNFTSVTAVRFGAVAAATFTVNSATKITATSQAATAATVDVTVSTAAGTSGPSSADHFAFTAPRFGCTSSSMSPSVASPQSPGTTATFTATATGCGTSQYEFFLQPPGGSWTAQTTYGGAIWAWNTSGLAAGIYGVGVWARSVGSGASYEAYWLGTYTLTNAMCTTASLSTATASPQSSGTSITYTATGCPGAQFRFWTLAPGGSWTMQRDFGASSWTWNTTGLAAGTYQLGVWARQPGSANAYDAYGFTTFALGSGNCISAGLSPSMATPQAPGATVVFAGTSNSCASPLYQFWLLPPGGSWTVEQSFRPATTWSWNTSGMPLGTYQVGVWAKASASTASYDVYFIGTYTLDVGPCTSSSISASPASPQAPGTSITFTASSTGCAAARYEFWELPPPGSTWSAAQPYGVGNTFSWNTTGLAPGPYRFGVWARQNGSTSSYDSYAIFTFWVGS